MLSVVELHGMVVGAVLGTGVIAMIGSFRSIRNYRQSPAAGKRAAAALVYTLAIIQFTMGLACFIFGGWFFLIALG